jgi:aminocarboxymuconate-semialdehyde decarboxylase
VTPHSLGLKWAIEFFGADRIMFGDDYPCWKTEDALRVVEDLNLSKADKEKIFGGNARRFFNLPEPVAPKVKEAAFA